jgi:transcriptional regulator with XRE-family HTH domain
MPRAASKLRDWRERRGLTQRELHERSRVSMRTLMRIERGEHKKPPSLADLVNLAWALDVALVDVIEDDWLLWTTRDSGELPPPPKPEWGDQRRWHDRVGRLRAAREGT